MNSDAMIEANQVLQDAPRIDDDPPDLEYAIAPILVYSDSTKLTNFGPASLWPIYVWFLNMCKYMRAQPSSFAAHHLAYIPSVSFIIHSLKTRI